MGLFESSEELQEAINQTIIKAWEACHQGAALRFNPTEQRVTVEELRELTRDEKEAVVRFIQRFMDYIWQDGPRMERAMKRMYIITHEFSSDHLLGMNLSQVGVMTNDTRQTMSARRRVNKRGLELLLKDPNYKPKAKPRGAKVRTEKYREVQQGNNNRNGGIKARRKFATVV